MEVVRQGTVVCYSDGRFVDVRRVGPNVLDIGFLRGYGVFDFARTVGGAPFLLDEHLKRFENSARILGLKVPLSRQKIKEVIGKLLAKNGFKESTIRLVLSAGEGEGLVIKGSPRFFIIITPFKPLPTSLYEKGVGLALYEHQRELPEAKTLNYLTAVNFFNNKKNRRSGEFFELLYAWQGKVLECSTSNIFIVKNKKLITPKDGILKGITRNFVLRIAKGRFKAVERELKLKELMEADEIFITTTNKDILPVKKIAKAACGGRAGSGPKTLWSGKPGPVTKELMESFTLHSRQPRGRANISAAN